eukprot:g964.t1
MSKDAKVHTEMQTMESKPKDDSSEIKVSAIDVTNSEYPQLELPTLNKFISDALIYWDEKFGAESKPLFTFMNDDLNVVEQCTYRSFREETGRLATLLLDPKKSGVSLKRGDRVLLVFPPSLLFMYSLVACIRAGLVPVPCFPPIPGKRKKDMLMFASISESSGANVVLTDGKYGFFKKVEGLKAFFSTRSDHKYPKHLKWIEIDSTAFTKYWGYSANLKVPQATSASFVEISDAIDQPLANEIAFLQYTSGSTSLPKGVMILQSTLAKNLSAIITALRADSSTVVVSWLPQYHDMGLIGSYLGTLYCGGSGYYTSPFTFVRNPCSWIEQISKHRATHCQAPNFAYSLAVRKWKTKYKHKSDKGIDLSSLTHMFNAAEPVRADSIEDFYDCFSRYNLPRDCIVPGYGLAESTVYVCDSQYNAVSESLNLHSKQRLVIDKKEFEERKQIKVVNLDQISPGSIATKQVSGTITEKDLSDLKNKEKNIPDLALIIGCGQASKIEDVDVIIVDVSGDDKDFKVLSEDCVGEIWIRSPSVAAGYYGNEEASKDFHAVLPDNKNKEYLRTGDEGFLHHGELFICGRMKDMLIVNGRNYYPQDLERSAEMSDNRVRPGCSAAFAVERTHENSAENAIDLVYVAEIRNANSTKKEMEALANILRVAIREDHELNPHIVVLVKPRTIPKTSSGKIARHWTKRALLEDKLSILFTSASTGQLDETEGIEKTSKEKREKIHTISSQGSCDTAEFVVEACCRILATYMEQDQDEIENDTAWINIREKKMNHVIAGLGMDSIALSELKAELDAKFEIEMENEWFYNEDEKVTMNKVVQYVCDAKDIDVVVGDDGEIVLGEASATPSTAELICCWCWGTQCRESIGLKW